LNKELVMSNKRSVWGSLILIAVLVAGLGTPLTPGAMAAEAEWESLIQGEKLNGWTQRNGRAKYELIDGVVVGTTRPDTPNSFLCTDRLFGNFILEYEFKVDERLNSGVQIRSESYKTYQDYRVHGYQVEIDPSQAAYTREPPNKMTNGDPAPDTAPRSWTAGIYDEARRGWLNNLTENEAARNALKQNDWNHIRIEAVDDTLKTFLNGVPAADLKDNHTPVGFIALQVHSVSTDEPLLVQWRNIRIQDLDTYPEKAAAEEKFVGTWESSIAGDVIGKAHVIAMGHGKYQAVLMAKDGSARDATIVMNGKWANGNIAFRSGPWLGALTDKVFAGGKFGDDDTRFTLKKVAPQSPTLGTKPPETAIVLLDGTSLDAWQNEKGEAAAWNLVEGGAMEVTPGKGALVSKHAFKDMRLHLEFRTPFYPEKRGQSRGNSGVYMQGRYEVQVLDSFGLEGVDNECGGIYQVASPKVNMCAPPGQWQAYDITFRAARFDAEGQKTENARITVVHNGVVIHADQELPAPTGSALKKGEQDQALGLTLQDHGDRVQYRNIWATES
jgi:hypothetical protein